MKTLWGCLLLGTLELIAGEKGPADAPLVLLVFGDFGSPHGARAKPVVEEFFKAYPGKVRLIFKHAPRSRATLAHEAALAAEAQGKFWQMHDLLYGAPQQPAHYATLARQLGLDVAKFEAALKEHRYLPAVERDLAEAKALGLRNAPMFFLNGKALAGAPAIGSLRSIANQELGLPVQVSTKDAPYRGPDTAPVTLIEFSDFQCGFCTRALGTIQQLMKEYPNKIQWLFKHYPLEFHRDAPLAHEAALAAGAQGKFWPMHDLLFERKTLKRDGLIGLAKELGLDVERFTKDLDSHKYRGVVEADRREGSDLGVEGTPTFFVNGKLLVGAQPIEAFRKLVEAELKKN